MIPSAELPEPVSAGEDLADTGMAARADEAAHVLRWRLDRFRELGYASWLAPTLAETRGADGFPLDWHAVARLVSAGCDRMTAVEILS